MASDLSIVRRGGGGGLNLKVVGGTSAPASPKENTVWVNTDTEITSYAFSATEPENPTEGMVWFATGLSSSAAMNVDKKNTVMLYPGSCSQYIGGAWVSKSAKTYLNGEWLDWFDYLFDAGNQYTDITGGWSANGWSHTGSGGTVGTVSIGETLKITTNNTSNAWCGKPVGTVNKIPLAGKNTIYVHISAFSKSGAEAELGILASTKKTVYDDGSLAETRKANIEAGGIYTLDVSNVNSEAYIAVYTHKGSTGTVDVEIDCIWWD